MSDSHTEGRNDLIDLAFPYALDSVSESERRGIVDQLGSAEPDSAREFARIVRDTRETMALVASVDALEPTQALRDRIFAAVDATPVAPVDELAQRRSQRRRLVQIAAAAAVAVVVALAGVAIGTRLIPHHNGTNPVAQIVHSVDVQNFTAVLNGGTVTVSASAQANAIVVSTHNVPAPPEGHVYQMWFIPAVGSPRSAGIMSSATMPPPSGAVVPALDSAATFAITVEPGSGSAQPTTTPIVAIRLT